MPSPTSPLAGRVVLVTGAARRVGAAIARALHAEGMRVALHFRRSRAEAEALAAELEAARPDSVALLEADLLDHGARARLVAASVDAFGRLDALVNNASSFYPTPLASADERAWDDLVGTNLKAPFFLAQAAARELREHEGAIVNVGDVYGEHPLRGYAIYCTAKGGLAALTRALALELAPGVRVNAVAPGAVLWPEGQGPGEARARAIVAATALERMGTPDDVAAAVRFLLRDARYTTGEVIAVDGGRTLRGR